MILDEYVWVSLSGSNIKYYESLGYHIPRSLVRDGHKNRITVKRGTQILVRIDDLQECSNMNVNVLCDYCGTPFSRPYKLIMNRRRANNKDACGTCRNKKAGESRKINFNDVIRSFGDRGYTLLTTEDEVTCLNTDKLKYMCPIHGEKNTTWNQFNSHGSGCDECAIDNNKIKLKQYAWKRILAAFNDSEYELLSGFDEYTNSKDNCLQCLCQKHGEFKTSWANYQRHQRCPTCSSSAGERSIADYLDSHQIEYEKPKRFDNLTGVGGGKLSYDFYLPTYNLLIEYQGAQHESPGHFSSSVKKSEENFIKQIEHDKRKREYALKNGYTLLEIWYHDFNNISNILYEYLTIQN